MLAQCPTPRSHTHEGRSWTPRPQVPLLMRDVVTLGARGRSWGNDTCAARLAPRGCSAIYSRGFCAPRRRRYSQAPQGCRDTARCACLGCLGQRHSSEPRRRGFHGPGPWPPPPRVPRRELGHMAWCSPLRLRPCVKSRRRSARQLARRPHARPLATGRAVLAKPTLLLRRWRCSASPAGQPQPPSLSGAMPFARPEPRQPARCGAGANT